MKRYIVSNVDPYIYDKMTAGRAAGIKNIIFNVSDEDAELLMVGDYSNHLPAMVVPPSTKPQIVQIDYLDHDRIQRYEDKFDVDVYRGFVFTYEDGTKRAYVYVPIYFKGRIIEYDLKYWRY